MQTPRSSYYCELFSGSWKHYLLSYYYLPFVGTLINWNFLALVLQIHQKHYGVIYLILCVWAFCLYACVPCVCTVCVLAPLGIQKRVLGSLELELPVVTIHHVGAENWTWVLSKNDMCSSPLSHLSSPPLAFWTQSLFCEDWCAS